MPDGAKLPWRVTVELNPMLRIDGLADEIREIPNIKSDGILTIFLFKDLFSAVPIFGLAI